MCVLRACCVLRGLGWQVCRRAVLLRGGDHRGRDCAGQHRRVSGPSPQPPVLLAHCTPGQLAGSGPCARHTQLGEASTPDLCRSLAHDVGVSAAQSRQPLRGGGGETRRQACASWQTLVTASRLRWEAAPHAVHAAALHAVGGSLLVAEGDPGRAGDTARGLRSAQCLPGGLHERGSCPAP